MAARGSDPGVSDTEAQVPPERWEGVDPSPREPRVKDQAKQVASNSSVGLAPGVSCPGAHSVHFS